MDGTTPVRLCVHSFLAPSSQPAVQPGFGSKFGHSMRASSTCVRLAQQAGVDFLVLDQTRPAIKAPLVRVTVPGLRHFYRGFAPGRVYNVPVNLRWCDRPLSEHELNAIHPHT